ncbi:hypothetical protein L486_08389 [Kwoniella mangroviensis CBS 10435]|uniref:Uncharacterized protein n=1 Tax=Kwoniella mangroviensis CBS 10435 TaxID=1331196 RepID=A0A1B9IF97_9TREE|nr:hypothetical protein L486_08389 [Kwoniella mangroviensis CBS 10435]
MARRRIPTRYHPKSKSPPSKLKTRLDLLTYAFSRLPPRQLPFLAIYAYIIIHAADREWVNKESLGKGGASIVGVLSMVTGLLVSYRFSSAITKWDEGRQVWAAVRITIRDGMRMLSVPSSNPPSTDGTSLQSSPVDLGGAEDQSQPSDNPKPNDLSSELQDRSKAEARRDPIAERVDELGGLLVGFAFALQHHLHRTRPLPQPPLCDLLPQAYLSSLKRTDARVRFAESHAGPSSLSLSELPSTNSDSKSNDDPSRPGLRRRGTGPRATLDGSSGSGEDEWELSNLRYKAEEAVTRLAEAVALSGSSLGDEGLDLELKQQLNQLNIPNNDDTASISSNEKKGQKEQEKPKKTRSNLHSPNPPNLPLSILKLIESYIIGLSTIEGERGGWNDSKRERGLNIVKALCENLGEAERLSSNPPPLPLTLHLSHLLNIYLAALPCSLLCVVGGYSLIFITLIAGWCLLGLEALISEVGGVFGSSENHLPLPLFTRQILDESLDISPQFLNYYRNRLISRVQDSDTLEYRDEIDELDRKWRRSEGEWKPSF